MAFAIMGSDKSIHRIWPDPDLELGYVPIQKWFNPETGLWDIIYGSEVLEAGLTESAADTQLDDVKAEMNTRESGSVKTVAEIDALS